MNQKVGRTITRQTCPFAQHQRPSLFVSRTFMQRLTPVRVLSPFGGYATLLFFKWSGFSQNCPLQSVLGAYKVMWQTVLNYHWPDIDLLLLAAARYQSNVNSMTF